MRNLYFVSILALFFSLSACSSDTQKWELGGPIGLNPCPSGINCTASFSGHKGTVYVQPLAYTGTISDIIDVIIMVVDHEGGKITMQRGNYVRAEFKKFLILPVVVEIFVNSDEDLIHFRAVGGMMTLGVQKIILNSIINDMQTPDE